MLFPQLYAAPFAKVLNQELAVADSIDVSVAWVRASGVLLLWAQIDALLARGGKVRMVVGIDRDNTSIEGLDVLADLAERYPEAVELSVRHNEASAIFHPKLYAFRRADECRVFVGSNNLTAAGLSTNEEIAGLLTAARGSDLEASLDRFFNELTSPLDELSKPLDRNMIAQLASAGYIDREVRLRGKAANQRRAKMRTVCLFGSRQPKVLRVPAGAPKVGPIEPRGHQVQEGHTRVFVRLRIARGTQGQLPVPLVRELRRLIGAQPEDGKTTVLSRQDAVRKVVSPTYPKRGGKGPNTYKIEAFRPRGMAVLKLEVVGKDIHMDQMDSEEPVGKSALKYIEDGLETDPPSTVQTTNNLDTATLYRFA